MQPSFAALFVLVAPLAACPSRAEPVVRSIDFTGVHAVAERELLSHMLTRRPDRVRFWKPAPVFSRGALEEDPSRISLDVIQRLCGHRDARSTEVYAKLADEALVEAIRSPRMRSVRRSLPKRPLVPPVLPQDVIAPMSH
ncbi:MAG: hypothetical protein ACYSXF_06940 [Planctomycetota bacterium]